jgi:TRAP-type mannitol/chloroaromatic compound transport system permease small subunit
LHHIMTRLLNRIQDLAALPGRLVGWLVLPLIVFVCLAVLAAKLGMNAYMRWEAMIPVLGQGVTVNTLLDLQWYIFAMMVLFGGVYAFRDNHHVSVDFLSAAFPAKASLATRLLGDLFLLLPFCGVITWYGVKFAMTSYATGEGSTYGGLLDRWLIKSCIPIGFGLLGIAALARTGAALAELLGASDERQQPGRQ